MKRENGIGKETFETTATAEERALARALDACEVPPMPAGTVEAIHRRVRAEAAARRMRLRRCVWALAAAVALLLGVWGVRPGGEETAPVASAVDGAGDGVPSEEEFYAEAEEEWLSPYTEQFEELETTLLAFEAMDFDSDDTVFPNL